MRRAFLLIILVLIVFVVLMLALPQTSWNQESMPEAPQFLKPDPRLLSKFQQPRVRFFGEGSLRALLGEVAIQTGTKLRIFGDVKDGLTTLSADGLPVGEVMDLLCQDTSICRWKMETYLVVWPAGDPTPEWGRPLSRESKTRATMFWPSRAWFSFREGSLREVIDRISSQTATRLRVFGEVKNRAVTISSDGSSVGAVMDGVCEASKCEWKIETYLVVWPTGNQTPEWEP